MQVLRASMVCICLSPAAVNCGSLQAGRLARDALWDYLPAGARGGEPSSSHIHILLEKSGTDSSVWVCWKLDLVHFR